MAKAKTPAKKSVTKKAPAKKGPASDVNVSTNDDPQYKLARSVASDSLNYVTGRMSELVTSEMEEGWRPHGNPITLIEDGKYILIQALTRNC